MRKGQAEIIILAGIIILGAVAILSALQGSFPSPVPPGVAQVQRQVKDSVLTLSQDAANDIVRVMENHGGYLSAGILEGLPHTTPESTAFLGQGVPYWQQCEKDISPTKSQIEQWLEEGVHILINRSLSQLGSFGTNVSFSPEQLRVDATLQDSKIDFAVTLPTQVEGHQIPQPYRFSIPTRFGRLVDFALDFSREAAGSRFLETHALASLYFSLPGPGGEPLIPTSGYLLECGEAIVRTPQQLSRGAKDAIGYSLAATLWWQPRPNAGPGAKLTQTQVFAVEDVNGKSYPDVQPRLFFPDDFEFQFFSPVIITNTNFDWAYFGPFNVPNCQSPYVQKYNLEFPVVTTVKDDLTGEQFSIASLAFISDPGQGKSMAPGSCGTRPTGQAACDSLNCTASITVTDTLGNPLNGTIATFGGCPLNETNNLGVTEGPILCGPGELALYHSEQYDFLRVQTDSASLNPATFALPRKPRLTVDFVPLNEGKACSVSPVDTEHITLILTSTSGGRNYSISNLDPDYTGTVSCDQQANTSRCLAALQGHLLPTTETDIIPSGTYRVDTWISNPTLIAQNPSINVPIISLQDTRLIIPPQEEVKITVHVPNSEQPLGEAISCLQTYPECESVGGGSSQPGAPGSACSPNIFNCAPFLCDVCFNENQRIVWTAEYFYTGLGKYERSTYERGFRNHLQECDPPLRQIEVNS